MTYESISHLVQTGGLLYFTALFAVVLVYALRPKSRAKFDAAAKIPLRED
jgi:cytochrome c oxidase cbb3-type subunit 4